MAFSLMSAQFLAFLTSEEAAKAGADGPPIDGVAAPGPAATRSLDNANPTQNCRPFLECFECADVADNDRGNWPAWNAERDLQSRFFHEILTLPEG
jgi:hypothetical protein